MKGGAFTSLLTNCNHQLSIKCIYDTQITPGVLQSRGIHLLTNILAR